MNGREKTQLQVERGTRPIVEAVDSLRLSLGFDKVQVLTPIVETRLRSGLLASRQMKVAAQSSLGPLLLTIPMGFPKVACAVEFDPSDAEGERDVSSLLEQLNAIAQETTADDETFIAPKDIVSRAEKTLGGESTESLVAGAESRMIAAAVEDDDRDVGDVPVTFFCCRRCRSVLFDSTELHEHHGRGVEYVSNSKCTSLFLEEPPRFLALDGSVQEGKILCPKCTTRVGAWSWVGSKCSCGEWMVPSYQFTKSKLDERKE